MNTLEGIAQRRPFHRVVIFLRDASGTYLLFPFPFEWREAKPRTSRIGFVQSFDSFSADVHEPPSPRPVRRLVAFNYRNSGPLHLVFQDLGLLGWRVAPHSVLYTISQVCVCVEVCVPNRQSSWLPSLKKSARFVSLHSKTMEVLRMARHRKQSYGFHLPC